MRNCIKRVTALEKLRPTRLEAPLRKRVEEAGGQLEGERQRQKDATFMVGRLESLCCADE